jgi:hypothetical protein
MPTTLFSTEASQPEPYTEFTVSSSYIWNSGQIQLPAGVAGVPAAIIQVAQPTAMKVVTWTASRIGKKPLVPDPRPTDPNLTLAFAQINVPTQSIDVSGSTRHYAFSGTYVYLMATSFVPGTDTLEGNTPVTDSGSQSDQQLDSFLFTKVF